MWYNEPKGCENMIDFQKFDLNNKDAYNRILRSCGERGCEYSLANLNLWGRQKAAFLDGYLVLFSQFERRSVYPFPVGTGDLKPVLDAIIQDARKRGIVCRLTGLTAQDTITLEERYPGQFRFHPDRDSCDYIYNIEDLATLKGKKFQKKRNHLNKFRQNHPDCEGVVITPELLPQVREMAFAWLDRRGEEDADEDLSMEYVALRRAFDRYEALGFEGMALREDGRILAMTLATRLSGDTFNVHFEKALEDVDGAYTAINQAFSNYLWKTFPNLQYLNREDDLGIPGLRKAKLSYNPDHLIVKFWAQLREEDDED
jgi:hypothetical protein